MLSLSAEQATNIRQHARAEYPHECCGALLGRELGGDVRWVEEVIPIVNEQKDNRERRFLITPAQMMQLEREAKQKSLKVLGFYHSHPDHPTRPSEFDRENALPYYSYLIISVQKGKPAEMHCWRLLEDRRGFEREPTEIRGL
jgi:proteasome lid subunit RPN8/RPN11